MQAGSLPSIPVQSGQLADDKVQGRTVLLQIEGTKICAAVKHLLILFLSLL